MRTHLAIARSLVGLGSPGLWWGAGLFLLPGVLKRLAFGSNTSGSLARIWIDVPCKGRRRHRHLHRDVGGDWMAVVTNLYCERVIFRGAVRDASANSILCLAVLFI